MIPHSHPQGHKRHQEPHAHPTELWRGLHRNWRAWVVIALMLAAIGIYVLTLDDSVRPGPPPPNTVSATTAPASPAK
ncbi:MAG: hypothetical protein P8168_05715 [Deltaproteobacteria bacterium]|jgi:hypothetical protein